MCSILTKGTLCDADLIGHDEANYLLSLCEDLGTGAFGVCVVDTASGAFRLGEFRDDAARSRLRTVLAQLRPEEVVLPRDALRHVAWAANGVGKNYGTVHSNYFKASSKSHHTVQSNFV